MPRLNVEVVISTPAGVVLVRRDIEPCKGQWHLPGGTVRFAEPLTTAAERVAWQELSVKVQVGPLIGYVEYPQMLADGYAGWPVGFAFEATVIDGTFSGTDQGRDIDCFHTVPANTIIEQAQFLTSQGLTRPGFAEPR
nr:NUDIX hydrolase [Micromonospora sp. DSM 115978]